MRLSQEFRSYTLFCIAFGLALVAFSGCSDSGRYERDDERDCRRGV